MPPNCASARASPARAPLRASLPLGEATPPPSPVPTWKLSHHADGVCFGVPRPLVVIGHSDSMRRSRVPRSGRPSISQQQFETQFLALSPQRLAVGERDRSSGSRWRDWRISSARRARLNAPWTYRGKRAGCWNRRCWTGAGRSRESQTAPARPSIQGTDS
jgi:hypothetical protein